MKVSRPSSIAVSWLVVGGLFAGCPGDDGGTSDEQGDHDHGDHDHGGTTNDHGDTTSDHGRTTSDHGGTTSDHGQATSDHGQATSDHQGTDTTGQDPAMVLCGCLFDHCHEPYHAKWGEDEVQAQQACLLEADGLPMNGADIDAGNFIECRQHWCDLAAADPAACTNALGDAVCL